MIQRRRNINKANSTRAAIHKQRTYLRLNPEDIGGLLLGTGLHVQSGSQIQSVERYRGLYGRYPQVLQADQIYRNRKGLAFCKEHGIRLSGPRRGRRTKDSTRDRKTEAQDYRERIIIESRNSIAKRRFGLDLSMAVRPETVLTVRAL